MPCPPRPLVVERCNGVNRRPAFCQELSKNGEGISAGADKGSEFLGALTEMIPLGRYERFGQPIRDAASCPNQS